MPQPPKERVRFTAWLSKSEREGIAEMAEEYGSSDNYIIRLAVRRFLGLVNPVEIRNLENGNTIIADKID